MYADNLAKLWFGSTVSLGICLASETFVTCASHKLASIVVGGRGFYYISMLRDADKNANSSGAEDKRREGRGWLT
jgi:hypothetical protein